MVYVVLGERGEYSERDVFVSGVYTSRQDAEDAVMAGSTRNRIYMAWADKSFEHLRRMPIDPNFGFSWTDAQRDEAEKLAGPKPEYERGEEFEIVECELGQWLSSHQDIAGE